MATKPIPAHFLPSNDDEDVFEVINYDNQTLQQTSQQKALEDILADLNDETDSAEMRIYRQVSGGKSAMVFLDSFPVDKYNISDMHKYLRDNYGGGDYRVHVRVNGKVRANKLISIEAPKSTENIRQSPIGEASNILATVLERQERMHQQMLEMMSSQNGGAKSTREMLEEMMLFKQLFDNGNSGGQQNGIQQLRDSLAVLSELGVTINGQSEEKEVGFGDLLEKMTPLIGAAMSQKNPPQQKSDPMFAQKMMIKAGLTTLIKAASKKADPISYAEMLFDQLPEDAIKEFVVNPGAFERVIKMEPKAAHYKVWFEDLAEHVKGQLGLPSKYSDLYSTEDDAINAESIIEGAPDNGTD